MIRSSTRPTDVTKPIDQFVSKPMRTMVNGRERFAAAFGNDTNACRAKVRRDFATTTCTRT